MFEKTATKTKKFKLLHITYFLTKHVEFVKRKRNITFEIFIDNENIY